MKNSKKLFLSLSAFACVLGLAACGGVSTALPPSNSGSGSSTPSTSTPAPAENTFGTGITDDEKAFFPSLVSGTGDFTKNTDFTATGSLTDRFDVKVGDTLKYIIYKGSKANGFGINITAYIGVDVSTFQISGFKTVGAVHSFNDEADISSLPLVGTDGNITVADGDFGGGNTGASVSARILVTIAKEAVAQAKVDAGSSTTENTFGDGITADEKEIFPILIKGTGDFTKNTDFTATGSLTDRFDVKVGGTLKYIIYKGAKANGFDINITAYIGVDVSTFQISGFKTVGDVHSYDTNADISSLPLVGTDGNITVENGSMSGATVSANTLVAIAKEAVAQATLDFAPVLSEEEKTALKTLAGTGTYEYNGTFTGTDTLTTRYDVKENGKVTKVIYKGKVLLKQGYYFTAYVAVDVNTHLITGYEVIGDVVSSAWTDYASSFEGWEDKFIGTDGSTVTDTVASATLTSNAFKNIAKAAVAQAVIDFE